MLRGWEHIKANPGLARALLKKGPGYADIKFIAKEDVIEFTYNSRPSTDLDLDDYLFNVMAINVNYPPPQMENDPIRNLWKLALKFVDLDEDGVCFPSSASQQIQSHDINSTVSLVTPCEVLFNVQRHFLHTAPVFEFS